MIEKRISHSKYQKIVDQQIAQLIKVSRYPVGIPEFPQLIPINDSVPWRVGTEPTQSSRQEIMLASVPKVAISLAMIRVLENLNIQERNITLDADTILELLGRDPNSVFNPESNQYGTYEELREVLSSLNIKFEDINSKDKFRSKEQAIRNALKDLKVSVDLNELLRQILTLSSNSATRIAKQLIVQNGRDIDEELKQLVPQYSPSPADMSRLQHYSETSKPNVGPIHERAKLLDDLVKEVYPQQNSPTSTEFSSATEGKRMLVDSMTNNSEDFGFDFTNSPLGKLLQSKGYRIVEKTGYYPCVYWVKVLQIHKIPSHHIWLCVLFFRLFPQNRKIR